MPADLTIDCPGCGCPDQPIGLACGFCQRPIPVPGSMVSPDGTANVEQVIGYRGWRIATMDDMTPRLKSPLYPRDSVWEPGEWQVAHCVTHGRHGTDHPSYHGPDVENRAQWSPVKGCGGGGHGCGFYAARTREHLVGTLPEYVRYDADDPKVIGKVQMAGKIIPASNGFRAQRVRPLVIYVPHELWRLGAELKKVYGPHGVEVEMSTTVILPKSGEGSIEWCRKCQARMGRSTTCPFCGHDHK